jgi:hypothetical protein
MAGTVVLQFGGLMRLRRFVMQKFIRSRALTALIVAAISVPAFAATEETPNDWAMAGDVLVARPFGMVLTLVGSALFVVSLPFTALGGNVKQAADTLVVGPAKETFVRCLGCNAAGRYQDPIDVAR